MSEMIPRPDAEVVREDSLEQPRTKYKVSPVLSFGDGGGNYVNIRDKRFLTYPSDRRDFWNGISPMTADQGSGNAKDENDVENGYWVLVPEKDLQRALDFLSRYPELPI